MSQSQKEAAEYAEVLMAYSRGERIQMRCSGGGGEAWTELTHPLWDFCRYEYRVAPKPVERWAVINPDHSLDFYFTKQEATRDLFHKEDGARVIHLREVTE